MQEFTIAKFETGSRAQTSDERTRHSADIEPADMSEQRPDSLEETKTGPRVTNPSGTLTAYLQPFTHLPLDTLKGEIRLLELQPGDNGHIVCEMKHAFLPDKPRYNCLSYVWGSPINPVAIQIHGSYVEVGRNLFSALSALRHPTKTRTLWIDALCINQKDLEERAAQVQQMTRIYTLARKTIVWIQEATLFATKAIQMLQELLPIWPRDARHPGEDVHTSDGEFWLFKLHELFQTPYLAALFSAKWFKRAWTLQEVIVTEPAVIWCGPERIPWDDMTWILEQCEKSYKGISYSPLNGVDEDFKKMSIVRSFYKSGEPEALIKLLLGLDRLATDPRDRVFALLGISSEPYGVKVSYTDSVETVFEGAARLAFRQGLADLVFCAVQPSERSRLPSWVPDFELTRKIPPLAGYSCARSSEWKINLLSGPGLLTVQGFQFSAISNIGKAADIIPVPHLTILRDWEGVILDNFFNEEMEILPYSEEFQQDHGHLKYCGASSLSDCHHNCFPTPKESMAVQDVAQHWFKRFITARNAMPEEVGYGRSAYQEMRRLFSTEQEGVVNTEPKWASMRAQHEIQRRRYPTGEPVTKAYFLTIMNHSVMNSGWTSAFTVSDLPVWNESYGKADIYEYARLRQVNWNEMLHKSLCQSIAYRRLVVLSNSYIGMAPCNTKIGDLVCVFSGAECPVVLRPTGDRFQFVGQCYVHGIMDGELFIDGDLLNTNSLENFTLC
jgi:hypothetical protein